MTRLINFTRGEAAALLHRLEAGTLAEVLAQDEPVHAHRADWIEASVAAFVATLRTPSPFVCLHSEHEITRRALDLDILAECVEGSTWPAAHDPAYNTDNSPQAYSGAVRCLHRAMLKIAAAFGKSPDYFDFPQA